MGSPSGDPPRGSQRIHPGDPNLPKGSPQREHPGGGIPPRIQLGIPPGMIRGTLLAVPSWVAYCVAGMVKPASEMI